MRSVCPAVTMVLLSLVGARASGHPGDAPERIDPAGIRGALVLCGGGRLPESVRDSFARLAGGRDARLVIIPTAGNDGEEREDAEETAAIWRSHGIGKIATLHTRSRDEANAAEFVAPLREATAVWITGGRQSQIAGTYSGTLVERELHALIDRGGVVGGTSAGAACQSRVMIVRGRVHDTPGLGLIPGAIIDQHFLARERLPRLKAALAAHPALVGFGIDEGSALVLQGRTLTCVGDSTVTICLGATQRCDCEERTLRPGDVSDLTMLRRAARARLEPAFPAARPAPTEVPAGSLVIAGGGEIPPEITARFVELAGGAESPIVILPIAAPGPPQEMPREMKDLARAGAKNVTVLTANRRDDVESPEFLQKLKEARGVWFCGGRQWRYIDAYEGTGAIAAFQGVLARGGVIGGTSAGATIQGDYLVRGSPLGNEQMMCPGYERGFAFLPGTAIDQHFRQRNRFADMAQLVRAHPQLLGIGLDESTALVVQGHVAEIVGQGQAHFYNRRSTADSDSAVHESVDSGQRFDLLERKRLGRN